MRFWFSLLLLIWCCAVGEAQGTPEAHLRIQGASGSPGLPVVTRIFLSHDLDCEAFSLGVSHDPTTLSGVDLQQGEFLENSALGGVTPDYLLLESNPSNGVGFIVGCLFDLTPPLVDLLAGTDQEILIATYSIVPTAVAGDTPLQFASDLHLPPVVLLVVMDGLEITPTSEDGFITVFIDCNLNGVPDPDDISSGSSQDCDGDGVPDECGFDPGSADCNGDGIPDVCEDDCNLDGISDLCQVELDCDLDGILDSCEISQGLEFDCDGDSVPDSCAVSQGIVEDCDGNGIPDSCDLDAGAIDCDADGIQDSCELVSGTGADCNANGTLDNCDLATGVSNDCNGNGVPDACDMATGVEGDCDGNGVPDSCDLTAGAEDCDLDGVLDSCAIAESVVEDCDSNGIPDSCDIAAGGDQDGDGTLDVCQDEPFMRGDCNSSGVFNIADAIVVLNFLFGYVSPVTCPDACDANDDEIVNIADAVFLLSSLFAGGNSPSAPFPLCGDDPEGEILGCPTYGTPCP